MQIDFVSIFPELIQNFFTQGVVSRAQKSGLLDFRYFNPRDFSEDKHRRVDDRPFGGGPGMLMKYEPLAKIAEFVNSESSLKQKPFHIFLSPQGIKFQQKLAVELAQKEHLVLWSGRYEGVDQRFLDQYIDLEISAGDFVLSGGEIAAVMVADAVSRFIDGVLGCHDSAIEDSFQNNLLDCPHYTRPEIVDKIGVPQVLLTGDHQKIARWRMKQALGRTFLLRPDIFCNLELDKMQKLLLNEFLTEYHIYGEKQCQTL